MTLRRTGDRLDGDNAMISDHGQHRLAATGPAPGVADTDRLLTTLAR